MQPSGVWQRSSLTVVLRTAHGDKGGNRNSIQETGDQLGSNWRDGGPEYVVIAGPPGFADGVGSMDKKGKDNSGSDLRNGKAGKTTGRGGL